MKPAAGFGLVETLVALAIGTFVAVAALSVYARSAADARTNGALQELHENARYAADLLEHELRAAGYAGLAPDFARVHGATPVGDAPPATLGVAGCTQSLALDLAHAISAANAAYAIAPGIPLGCDPATGARWSRGTDTLTIRRASAESATPERGRLQLASTRSQGLLLADGALPEAYTAGRTHDLEVSTFYVSASAVGAAGVPALRRKRLVGGPGGPRFDDEELVVGVEDLQIEIGVDGPDADEIPERYVPADRIEASDTPRTVRFSLRVRAQQPDPSWRDRDPVTLADHVVAPTGDAYRRIVVSRTVFLRNQRRR
jgi:type IV pilus assembly protein PilW